MNPWGISFVPGQDFWIANNNSGTSTLYDAKGNKDGALVVTIPGAAKNPNGNCSPGCPTGNVSNPNGTYFGGGQFIFDTEDGIVANWTGASNTATVVFDNSASGAVYKGLALLNGTFLLAANFNSGKVDVLDRNFNLTSLSGSFTDPKLPAGFAPHGIHVIGNQIYVAYAMQDAAKHDAQDNYGTHKHPEVKKWFRAHPRYHVHFTPTSASWLNQVERWFAEITRKRIRRGTFRSVRDLVQAIQEYIRENNKSPRPFQWVASANTIVRKVRKYKWTLETAD